MSYAIAYDSDAGRLLVRVDGQLHLPEMEVQAIR